MSEVWGESGRGDVAVSSRVDASTCIPRVRNTTAFEAAFRSSGLSFYRLLGSR